MERVPLSLIDLFFTGAKAKPFTMALWFEGQLDEKRLTLALEKTMDIFYPCKGEIVVGDDNRIYLDHFHRSIKLSVKTTVITLGPESESELLTLAENASNDPTETLCKFTLVKSPQHHILITSFSHVLTDAVGYFELMIVLSQLYSGKKTLVPTIKRHFFEDTFAKEPFIGSTINFNELMGKNHGFVGEIKPEKEKKIRENSSHFNSPFTDSQRQRKSEEEWGEIS